MKSIVIFAALILAVNCLQFEDHSLSLNADELKEYLLKRFPDGNVDFCGEYEELENDNLLHYLHNAMFGNVTANATISVDASGQRTIKINDALHHKSGTITQNGNVSGNIGVVAGKGKGSARAGAKFDITATGKTTAGGKTLSGKETSKGVAGILIRHRCRDENSDDDEDDNDLTTEFERRRPHHRHRRPHHRRQHRRHRGGTQILAGVKAVRTLSGDNFSRQVFVKRGAKAVISKGRGGINVWIGGGSKGLVKTTVGNKTEAVSFGSRGVASVVIRQHRKDDINEQQFDEEEFNEEALNEEFDVEQFNDDDYFL